MNQTIHHDVNSEYNGGGGGAIYHGLRYSSFSTMMIARPETSSEDMVEYTDSIDWLQEDDNTVAVDVDVPCQSFHSNTSYVCMSMDDCVTSDATDTLVNMEVIYSENEANQNHDNDHDQYRTPPTQTTKKRKRPDLIEPEQKKKNPIKRNHMWTPSDTQQLISFIDKRYDELNLGYISHEDV